MKKMKNEFNIKIKYHSIVKSFNCVNLFDFYEREKNK